MEGYFLLLKGINTTLLFIILTTLMIGCSSDRSSKTGSDKPKSSIRAPQETEVSNVQFSKAGSTSFDVSSSDSEGNVISCDENELSVELEISRDGTDDSFESISQENIIVDCNVRATSDIALVLDNSGSEKDHIQDIIDASSKMAEEILGNGGKVSMTRVSTNSKVIGSLSDNISEVKGAIAQQKTGNGWTSLFDGMRLGNETLANSDAAEISNKEELTSFCEANRKLGMVVFTDGRENNSNDEKSYRYDFVKYPGDGINTSLDDLKKLRVGNVTTPIYNIGMGPDVDHELLSSLSKETGGRYLHIQSREQIPNVFEVVKDYISTPSQVCAKFSKNICGSRKLKMKYKWKSRKTGESIESNESEKIVNVHIPCSGDTDTNNEIVEDDSSKEEQITDSLATTLAYPNNIFTDNRTTKLYFPPFDNNNGKKELLGVVLYYKLKGSSKILAANFGQEASESAIAQVMQNVSINGTLGSRSWSFHESVDDSSEFKGLNTSNEEEIKSYKNGISNNNIGSFNKTLELSGKHRFLSQDYTAFKGYRPYQINITHKPYMKIEEGSDPDMFYDLDFRVSGDVRLAYQWRTVEKPYIKFLDKGLESAIRAKISKSSGNIYMEDVADITSLNISNKSISSLEGIQYLKNLTTLTASRNKISDLTPISKLTTLKSLSIDRNNIDDIGALSSLISLNYLNLNTNKLTLIDSIVSLTDLTSLYIGNNNIEDISVLSKLTKMNKLGINNNPITNINSVSGLSELTYLYMNQILCECDLSLLEGLQKLYYLSLSSNTIINDKYLTLLPELKRLSVTQMKSFNFEVLSYLKLTHLYLSSNKLTHLNFLKGLSSLQQLFVGNNLLDKNCQPVISSLIGLKRLWLNNNNFNEGIDLSSLAKLYEINLDGNGIEKLNLTLSSSNVISKLWLRHNSLSELNSVEYFSHNLTHLYLDSNNFENLNSLEGLEKLIKLYSRDNLLNSIDTVKGLQTLTHLYFDRNKISGLDALLNLNNLRVARLFKNSTTCSDQKILVDMKYAGKIVSYSNLSDCEYQYVKDKPPVEEKPVEEVKVEYGESTVQKFITGNLFLNLNSSNNYFTEKISEVIKIDPFNDENGSLEVYEISVKVFAGSALQSTARNFETDSLSKITYHTGSHLSVDFINNQLSTFSKSDTISEEYSIDLIKASNIEQYNAFLDSDGSVNSDLFPSVNDEQEIISEYTVSGDELATWLKAENLSIQYAQEFKAESPANISPNFSININANLSGTLVMTYKYKKK